MCGLSIYLFFLLSITFLIPWYLAVACTLWTLALCLWFMCCFPPVCNSKAFPYTEIKGTHPGFLPVFAWFNFLHLHPWPICSLFFYMVWGMDLVLSFSKQVSSCPSTIYLNVHLCRSWDVIFMIYYVCICTWMILIVLSMILILCPWSMCFLVSQQHAVLITEAF